MTESEKVKELFENSIKSGRHEQNDYFSVLREMINKRESFANDSAEYSNWQDGIDNVYSELYDEIIEKFIKSDPRHVWFVDGFDPKKINAMKKYYKDRYNQNVE